MNAQFLQLIQKVHGLEAENNSNRLKIKSLESQLWDIHQESKTTHKENLPSGTIILFNGQKIPPGWLLCDGTNKTPELSFPSLGENHEKPVYIMKA